MARHRIRRARSFSEDGEPDMTPLIDCVFLLLIFFMVTTVFLQTKGLEDPQHLHQILDLLVWLLHHREGRIAVLLEAQFLSLQASSFCGYKAGDLLVG